MVGICNTLVQKREGISHGAVRDSCNQICGILVESEIFMVCDIEQSGADILRLNAPEVEALTAGNYCCGYLVHLGCGKDKLDVSRGLLHDFQKCIERLV